MQVLDERAFLGLISLFSVVLLVGHFVKHQIWLESGMGKLGIHIFN